MAERIQRGDAAAEEEFALRYRDQVFAVALAKLADYDAAEDVTQEALVSSVQRLREGNLRDLEKIGAFACGTARNLANNRLRFRRRHPTQREVPTQTGGSNPEEEASRHEEARIVGKLVEQLEATDQKILLWSLVDGLSSDEIGQRLDRTPSSVRQRKHRALERLRARLDEMSQIERSGHKKEEAQ